MLRLIRQPVLWLCALLGWNGTLWWLSSLRGSNHKLPITHFDKFLHFTYFFAGGMLFAGWCLRRNPGLPDWKRILPAAIIIMALIGFIDEWHQCYTPGRSGADIWDWTADVIGAAAGAFTLKFFHRHFR